MLIIYQNTTSLISIDLPSTHNYYLFVFKKGNVTIKSIYQTIVCANYCFEVTENIGLGIWDINIYGQSSSSNLDPNLATFLYDNDVEVKINYDSYLVNQKCNFLITENGDNLIT
jgi:hypothetical protein